MDPRQLVFRAARGHTERGDVGAPHQLELRFQAHALVGMLEQQARSAALRLSKLWDSSDRTKPRSVGSARRPRRGTRGFAAAAPANS